jgi:hypothetical protein
MSTVSNQDLLTSWLLFRTVVPAINYPQVQESFILLENILFFFKAHATIFKSHTSTLRTSKI